MSDDLARGPSRGVPTADVVPARRFPWAWIPPALALVLVAVAAWTSWRGRGLPIEVHFQHGHGIKTGDTLRYRGITVGEVESVRLAGDLLGVAVGVRLDERAEGVARAGSRFWVVRPQIGLSGVVGLDTVVGARYLAVHPGDLEGPRETEFVGLEEPPVLDTIEPGSLEVVLEARARRSLGPGAPVTYRGIEVGRVTGVGLESDGTSVEVRCSIGAAYATLVRENTRFWGTGGLLVDIGLGGVQVEVDSLESLVAGGVGLATPNEPGLPAVNGARFTLFAEPEEEWLDWRPPLPLGRHGLAAGDLPAPRPAVLRWREGRLLKSDERRRGWLLPVEGGLLGPADLLAPPEDAEEGSVLLRVGGEPESLPAPPAPRGDGLAFAPFEVAGPAWRPERMRRMEGAEDCLLVADPASTPLALAAGRLLSAGGYWRVEDAVPLGAGYHGAGVVARADGRLVGVLLVGEDGARIAPPL